MKWFYVENGQQAGPVEETDFSELIRTGKLRAETLVWREGLANWEPFSKACPNAAPSAVPPVAAPGASSNDAVCVECGGIFDKNEMIAHAGAYVCARCKPVFMQKLSEGGGASLYRPAGSLTAEELATRDYAVDLGDYLSRAWTLFKANAGGMIAASVLVYLAIIAINIIPYLNFLLGLFLTGPLIGGLWVYYLKCVRQQSPTMGDAFSGFGPRYWQLVLAQLIPTLITMGLVFAIAMVAAITIPAFAMAQRNAGGGIAALSPVLLVIFGVVALVVAAVVIYLSVCWLFALPLVADKGLAFWPALQLSRRMVVKHWWLTFLLLLVGSLVGMLGMIACLVGALVTGPVAFGMWACHYERVFGELAPQR